MVASFPDSIKTWTPLVDGVDQPLAADWNTAYDEITAIESNAEVNGWRPGGTWTRASATTITVDAGALNKYSVGDKIKLIQARSQAYTNDPAAGNNIVLNMASTANFNIGNKVLVSSSAGSEVAQITAIVANTSITVDVLALNHTTTNPIVYIGITTTGVKYFYVVAVADALITICAGWNYTLENSAITSGYYSHGVSPVGFPDWFNFNPSPVGWSTLPTIVAKMKIVGRQLLLAISTTTAGSVSNTTTMNYQSPIASISGSGCLWHWGVDNSVQLAAPGRLTIAAGATTITAYKTMDSGSAWTAALLKGIDFMISIPI